MCSFPVVCSPLCSCSESVFIISNRATKWPQWDFSRPSSKTANSISSTSSLLRGPRQRREDRKNLSSSLFKLTSAQSFRDKKDTLMLGVCRRVCLTLRLISQVQGGPICGCRGQHTRARQQERQVHTHTHTPVLCSCRGYTAAGRTRTAADRWSSSIPCHSQHVVTHTHTHHRTQHHLSLLQLIKLIKLVM